MSVLIESSDPASGDLFQEIKEKRELSRQPTIESTIREVFDTQAYLKDFYTHVQDPAMQLVLTFLPNIVARLPRCETLLDFGAGPTIHVAVCFRDHVDAIYLADYMKENRNELHRWLNHESDFDWSRTLQLILSREGVEWTQLKAVEEAARDRVKGVLFCDCFASPAVEAPAELSTGFDIITSFFTLEYCSATYDEYIDNVKRVVDQVTPGGYFILGGILEETWCSFGGRDFACLFITREFVLKCLHAAGLAVDYPVLHIEINGMFLICVQKLAS